MKRRLGDDPDGAQPAPAGEPHAKRFKSEPLPRPFDASVDAILTELKQINKGHHLWTYFKRTEQQSLGTALNLIDRPNFENLKHRLETAKLMYEEASKIELANRANDLNIYVPSEIQTTDKLVVMFMNIGSGDCIFIKTPKGKTIVVDCGQRSSLRNREYYREEIQDMLKSPLFLGGDQQSLYALILTHPDKDHYNEVTTIIEPCVSSVMHAFYTLKKGQYSSRSTYQYLGKAKILNRVTINSSVVDIQTSEREGWEKLYYKIADKRMIQILGYDRERANWDEDTCNIYLLAAEVPKKYRDTKQNAASIVTLIEVHNRFEEHDDPDNEFSRKVLLTGDATLSTEDFLLEEHNDLIGDVDLVQLEHHGAGTEHAREAFVSKINPVLAVASSGPHKSDMNPRWDTIEKYVVPHPAHPHRLCRQMDQHKIKCSENGRWTNKEDNPWSRGFSTYGLFTTESNNDVCFIIDKDGNLIREFSDSNNTHTYTISRRGNVTLSSTPIKKQVGGGV